MYQDNVDNLHIKSFKCELIIVFNNRLCIYYQTTQLMYNTWEIHSAVSIMHYNRARIFSWQIWPNQLGTFSLIDPLELITHYFSISFIMFHYSCMIMSSLSLKILVLAYYVLQPIRMIENHPVTHCCTQGCKLLLVLCQQQNKKGIS